MTRKWVATLGEFPVPIEVIPMATSYVARQLVKARGRPVLRKDFVTDNGNAILDVHDLRITNPVGDGAALQPDSRGRHGGHICAAASRRNPVG